jgi:hypothetical protein
MNLLQGYFPAGVLSTIFKTFMNVLNQNPFQIDTWDVQMKPDPIPLATHAVATPPCSYCNPTPPPL